MRWFANLPIARKLLLAFGTVVALTIGIGTFALQRTARLNDVAAEINDSWIPGVTHSLQASLAIQQYRIYELGHILAPDSTAKTAIEGLLAAQVDTLQHELKAYEPTMLTAADSAGLRDTRAMWSEYAAITAKLVALSRSGETAQAQVLVTGESKRLFDHLAATTATMAALNTKGATKVGQEGQVAYRTARMNLIAALCACVLLGVLLAVTIARSLSHRIAAIGERTERLRSVCAAQLNAALHAMAGGDPSIEVVPSTTPLDVTSRDELGKLAGTVNAMIAQTQGTIAAYNAARVALQEALAQTARVVTAAGQGNLDVRGETGTLGGAYRDLVQGTNDALEAVVVPMRESTSVLERLADRDLTARVLGSYLGDHARVQHAVNAAVDALAAALGQVRQSSEQVAAAGSQIATGSQTLAAGASEQAAGLEEISASVHELASMADRTLENAREGQTLSAQARSRTAEGATSMSRLAEALAEIRGSAVETAKIVRTIDEIAFQTNLLALNAAVEAARAGDAGRGFAVVAEEVRALALRSAEAAKTTATLIERSQAQATGGATLGATAEAQFRELESGVERTTEVMAEIAAAAEQQADGVRQINAALEQMSGVTQQTAANAEESASAAAELSSEAERLQNVVAGFVLDEPVEARVGERGGRPRAAVAAALAERAPSAAPPRSRRPARVGR
jgi:methyl-accepting chemotaxis protein